MPERGPTSDVTEALRAELSAESVLYEEMSRLDRLYQKVQEYEDRINGLRSVASYSLGVAISLGWTSAVLLMPKLISDAPLNASNSVNIGIAVAGTCMAVGASAYTLRRANKIEKSDEYVQTQSDLEGMRELYGLPDSLPEVEDKRKNEDLAISGELEESQPLDLAVLLAEERYKREK